MLKVDFHITWIHIWVSRALWEDYNIHNYANYYLIHDIHMDKKAESMTVYREWSVAINTYDQIVANVMPEEAGSKWSVS